MEIAVQLISAATAIIALLLIWLQLSYQTKQMRFEALTQLHQELIKPEMQKALRFIYNSDPEKLSNPTSEEAFIFIESVLNMYDLIGFRLRQGVLPRKATLETEWMVLLRIWPQLKPFIEAERLRRGNRFYKEHFEWLVNQAEQFKEQHYPGFISKIYKQTFEEEFQNSKPCIGVIILDKDRLLLVRRAIEPFKDYWDIPGGFLEVGEHPEAGAVREVREETGLVIKPTETLGIFMDVYGSKQVSTLNICYIANIIGGQPYVGSDAAEMEWFPVNALPDNIAFQWARDALQLLGKRFQN
jgi:ADP-ribose pyrophosphatase YjhB (NUDIX family)